MPKKQRRPYRKKDAQQARRCPTCGALIVWSPAEGLCLSCWINEKKRTEQATTSARMPPGDTQDGWLESVSRISLRALGET